MRMVLFPYRKQAQGPDDFFYHYDKIPGRAGRVRQAGPARHCAAAADGPRSRRPVSPPLAQSEANGRRAIGHRAGRGHGPLEVPTGLRRGRGGGHRFGRRGRTGGGRIYNVAESVAFTEAERVRWIGEAVGWTGEVVTVGLGRISLPFRTEQGLDTDSTRIRRELGFAEVVSPHVGQGRTIGWEGANPSWTSEGVGLLGHEAEDVLLTELGGQAAVSLVSLPNARRGRDSPGQYAPGPGRRLPVYCCTPATPLVSSTSIQGRRLVRDHGADLAFIEGTV